MKKALIATLLTCATLGTTFSAAVAQSKLDFTLINDLELDGEEITITHVYISDHDIDDWQDDMLGEDNVLEYGDETEITFHPDDEAVECWDLGIEEEGSDEVHEWRQGIELQYVNSITITTDDEGEMVVEVDPEDAMGCGEDEDE